HIHDAHNFPYSSDLHRHYVLPHLHSFPTRRSSDLIDHCNTPWSNPTRSSLPVPTFDPVSVAVPFGVMTRVGPVTDRRALDSVVADRKSTRLNSSHVKISYAVFCLK